MTYVFLTWTCTAPLTTSFTIYMQYFLTFSFLNLNFTHTSLHQMHVTSTSTWLHIWTGSAIYLLHYYTLCSPFYSLTFYLTGKVYQDLSRAWRHTNTGQYSTFIYFQIFETSFLFLQMYVRTVRMEWSDMKWKLAWCLEMNINIKNNSTSDHTSIHVF